MIFVTIGTQAPFDRLIKVIDEIAPSLNEEVIAQTFDSDYKVKNMTSLGFVDPKEFNIIFDKARLIISHAGMGTIISALNKNKPIIVLPRIAALGEHRNEHQSATAKKMDSLGLVKVVYDESQLSEAILNISEEKSQQEISNFASNTLTASLHKFIFDAF